MKFSLIFLISFCLCTSLYTQTCFPSGISFSTQASIDSFEINNPGCTHILGSVVIVGNDLTDPIVNLNGLNSITAIDGFLAIANSPALLSISGLNNLTTLGDQLIIRDNPVLQSISGLTGLVSIAANASIFRNDQLTSITGLSSLSTVNGYLAVFDCVILDDLSGLNGIMAIDGALVFNQLPDLISLPAFPNLTTVGDNLSLQNNDKLTNISGFASLVSVGGIVYYNMPLLVDVTGHQNLSMVTGLFFMGSLPLLDNINGFSNLDTIGSYLSLADLPKLPSLSAFSSLVSINGFIRIAECDDLLSLNGLDNIDHIDITDLKLLSNPNLTTCELQNICDYLDIASNTAEITGNALGCATRAEVETACLIGLPVDLIFFEGTTFQNKIQLDWITAGEWNNAGFYIERSGDGITWHDIGFVRGAGETKDAYVYSFVDDSNLRTFKHIYYRLKQVDVSGEYSYSNIISVLIERENDVHIYPNPVHDVLTIETAQYNDIAHIIIYDCFGKTVKNIQLHNSFTIINLKDLDSGIYTLTLYRDYNTRSYKFVKIL